MEPVLGVQKLLKLKEAEAEASSMRKKFLAANREAARLLLVGLLTESSELRAPAPSPRDIR
jgi:hypothetical protein